MLESASLGLERGLDRRYLMLTGLNLKPKLFNLLANGLSTGILSPQEIASALPKRVKRDRVVREEILDWLFDWLRLLNIKVASDEVKQRFFKTKYGVDKSVEILLPSTPEEEKAQSVLGNEMFSLCKALTGAQDEKNKRELRNRVVVRNINLPRRASFRYVNLIKDAAIDIDDLYQEGISGLIRATELFDYLRGYRYSTYADWWINQRMQRLIDHSGTVSIPVHVRSDVTRFEKAESNLQRILGRKATREEVLEKLGWPKERFEAVLDALRFEPEILCLDEPAYLHDSEGGLLLSETIPAEVLTEEIPGPQMDNAVEKAIFQSQLRKRMEKVFSESGLLDVERYCLKEYFGSERTLEEIGEALGVTRQRVHQRIEKALWKLRTPHNWKRLKDFVSGTYKPKVLVEKDLEGYFGLDEKEKVQKILMEDSDCLEHLPSRQKNALKLFFGIDQVRLKSFQEIGLMKSSELLRQLRKGIDNLPETIWRKIADILGVRIRLARPIEWYERERPSQARKREIQPFLLSVTQLPLSRKKILRYLKLLSNFDLSQVTPKEIIEQSAHFFGFSREELLKPKRTALLATVRQIIMYALHEYKGLSYSQIAWILGKKDHTTIIHGCQKIKTLLGQLPKIKYAIDRSVEVSVPPQITYMGDAPQDTCRRTQGEEEIRDVLNRQILEGGYGTIYSSVLRKEGFKNSFIGAANKFFNEGYIECYLPTRQFNKRMYRLFGFETPKDLEEERNMEIKEKDIRKAYYKLASQYHPDRRLGDKIAEERFKMISHAYRRLLQRRRWIEKGII